MKLYVLMSLLVSQVAFAGGWSIKNIWSNTNSSVTSIEFGSSAFYSLTQGYSCIDGSIKSAYSQLKLVDSQNTIFTKRSLEKKKITVEVRGPVCVEYEPWMDGDCLKTDVKTREYSFSACDKNQKFFPRVESPSVEFSEVVKVEQSSKWDKYTNEFYSGSLQLSLFPTLGRLTIVLNSWAYGTSTPTIRAKKEITILLDPKLDLTKQSYPYELHSESSGLYDHQICIINKVNSNLFSVECSIPTTKTGKIYVPAWALGKADESTQFTVESNIGGTLPEFRVKNVITNKSLDINVDYASVSELWEKIYPPNTGEPVACLENDPKNIKNISAALFNCNRGCAQSVLYSGYKFEAVGVENEGLKFFKTKEECVRDEGDDYTGYRCLEYKTVKASFVIPYCN